MTSRDLCASGTGPLFLFFFHLLLITYFSFKTSYILGTDIFVLCSFSKKYCIFWPQQSISLSLVSHTQILTSVFAFLGDLFPLFAPSYRSRNFIKPCSLIPLIQSLTVSLFLPMSEAILTWGTS